LEGSSGNAVAGGANEAQGGNPETLDPDFAENDVNCDFLGTCYDGM